MSPPAVMDAAARRGRERRGARRRAGLVALLGVAVALALLGTLVGQGWPTYAPIGKAAAGVPYVWRGAFHVHTERSADAHGTLEEAVAAAAARGLDFIVVTDHTAALGAAGRVRPRWHGRVLVVPAEEISTDEGHLIALNVPPHEYALGPTAVQAMLDIAELGGEAIIAHPTGGEVAWRGPWGGAAGLEVASWSAAMRRTGPLQRARLALLALWRPGAAAARAMGRHGLALETWDERTRSDAAAPRPLAGVGALDAHGALPVLGFPSYRTLMGTLTTAVWMDRPPRPNEPPRRTAAEVAARLARGRAYVELTSLGRAPGFLFAGRAPGGRRALPGDVVDAAGGWQLSAALGAAGPYRIVLLRDGAPVAQAEGTPLEFHAVRPGTYRVEVYRQDATGGGARWLLSNPIYVWPRALLAVGPPRPAPRLPAPPVDRDLLALPGWDAEDGGGGHSALAGGRAGGLLWEVGLPADGGEDAYAALAWRPPASVDWNAYDGVAVRLRSSATWRVAVWLWTRGADGTEATWEGVVPADATGRGEGLRWDRFRRLERSGRRVADGGPKARQIERVTGLALVVTPQRMKPGTVTRIEVLAVGPFASASPALPGR